MKIDLEAVIRAIDSKRMEFFFESADSKRKKLESAAQHIGAKHWEFEQIFAK